MSKQNIRTPGTRVKVTSKSTLHAGQIGRVVSDYDKTILIKAENARHKHAYTSLRGVNDEGLDPKEPLEGKYFMVYPQNLNEIKEY